MFVSHFELNQFLQDPRTWPFTVESIVKVASFVSVRCLLFANLCKYNKPSKLIIKHNNYLIFAVVVREKINNRKTKKIEIWRLASQVPSLINIAVN